MPRVPAKRARTAVTTVKLPRALNDKVMTIVRKRRANKSTVIRQALEALCQQDAEVQAEPGSFLDVARDFAGCLEGPADLSYNKKHMEGYGR